MNKEKIKRVLEGLNSTNGDKVLNVFESDLDRIDKVIQEKIKHFNEVFPQLEFDKHGRAVIKVLDNVHVPVDSDALNNILNRDYDDSMFESILEVIENREYYKAKCKLSIYRRIDTLADVKYFFRNHINLEDLVNKGHFTKKATDEFGHTIDKFYNIKFTKILSEAKAIWMVKNEKLQEIIRELKEENKKEEKDMEKIFELRDRKKEEEEKHIFTLIDRYMSSNKKGKNETIYLSVNPLDRLFMSGTSTQKNHITSFHSCMALEYEIKDEEYLRFEKTSMGSPYYMLNFGLLSSICIIFNTNGRVFEFKGREFLGMKSRTIAWLEDKVSEMFLEVEYPTKDDEKLDIYCEALSSQLDINSSYEAYMDDEMRMTYTESDYYVLSEVADRGIFLDRVYVDNRYGRNNRSICKMDELRTDMNYNDGVFTPDGGECCELCDARDHEDNMYTVYNSYGECTLVCDSCYRESASECDHCGDSFYDDDLRRCETVGGDDTLLCQSCFDDNYHECSFCECVSEYSGDFVHLDSGTYCDDCAERKLNTCGHCGEYTDSSLERDDGEAICDDCSCHYVECPNCASLVDDSNEVCDSCESNLIEI